MVDAPERLRELVREVVSIPSAPYLEGGVRDYLRDFAAARGLAHEEDAYGNVRITYRRGRRRRPLVLGAHMDHPGFVVEQVRGRGCGSSSAAGSPPSTARASASPSTARASGRRTRTRASPPCVVTSGSG